MTVELALRAIRALSDDVLVANLNARAAALDAEAARGVDVERTPRLAFDRDLVAALRAEYRTRTGEVI